MDTQAIVFNIQKFSLHDGPGIRTVVFLKGCPLRCLWCSNPESQVKAIQQMDGEEKGKVMSVDEVLTVCLQDKDFYEESGGGVTFSGGEALMHPAFVIALADRLRAEGIHTAIETTGYAKPSVFEQVIEHIDLLLFDVKHYNSEKHYTGTNVYNDLILDNLRRALARGKEILPRIPVIPMFNNSISDAHSFTDLFCELGIKKVQLLPFHQFGEKKYELLHMTYQLGDCKALHPEDLEEYKQVFCDGGINCFI